PRLRPSRLHSLTFRYAPANRSAIAADAVVWFGDEADLDHAAALNGENHAPHRFVAGVLVGADVDLRLRLPDRRVLHQREQLVAVGDPPVVPVDVAIDIDRDGDVLRLGLRRDVDGDRKSTRLNS